MYTVQILFSISPYIKNTVNISKNRFICRGNYVTKGNTAWAHFTVTGYFPTNIHLSRPIPTESVRLETRCCIFKRMIIDWTNMEVTGISGIKIEMPNEAKISIFMDNDLTHNTDDHFKIKLVVQLFDQIYVVNHLNLP